MVTRLLCCMEAMSDQDESKHAQPGASATTNGTGATRRRLEGRVAIVTGASMGIGEASARALADEGAKVVCCARGLDLLEKVVASINDAGGEAVAVKADCSVEADQKKVVDVALEKYGKLDIAFNNVSIVGKAAPLWELTDEDFSKVQQTNTGSMFYGLKYQIPAMIRNGGGSIINNTSNLALKTGPAFANFGSYVTSKFAQTGLTYQAAVETVKHNIRVNAVATDSTWTPLWAGMGQTEEGLDKFAAGNHLIPRAAKAHEVAKKVVFLASDDSSMMTATTLDMSGGFMQS